jgi:hypothetical protein
VTPPTRQRDYHVEFALTGNLQAAQLEDLDLDMYKHNRDIDWELLKAQFTIYKNNDLSEVTSYGTWHLNSDPRDGSSNIEVAALTMDGAVSTIGSWGPHPYTFAHAWMHAAIIARICAIKGIDALGSFDPSVESSVLQNGPIFVVSTHAERALQTNDDGQDTVVSRGYGMFSGDSQERWDIAALDPSRRSNLVNPAMALASVQISAAWIRTQAHYIKSAGVSDLWGLDKDPT